MTGHEHYREAERQASTAKRIDDPASALVAAQLAAAHATLALAAATALSTKEGMPWRDQEAWDKAAGLPRPTED
jgi:hypothetical protein